ncbi:MAG: autotransporter-associated beta strand repeat-containing protein [Alphaproteobacteria bacterium]|nr:autotransporter-associated beta strand repeat-containing protein [Alphaproteobacteria bacterium]
MPAHYRFNKFSASLAIIIALSASAFNAARADNTFTDINDTSQITVPDGMGGFIVIVDFASGYNTNVDGNLTDQISAGSTYTKVISGAGNVTIDGSTSLSPNVNAWTLSGANTYTGTTTITSGAVLAFGANNVIASSASVVNNGRINIAATTQTLQALSGSGTVTTSAGGSLTHSGTSSWGGVISGAGDVATTGTGNWTITVAQTYTGTTNVGSGTTLTLSTTNDIIATSSAVTVNGTVNMTGTDQTFNALAGSGSVVTDTGHTLTENGTATWAGVISGAGNLATTGTGNWTLTTAQTYTGTTNVGAGSTLTLSTTADEIATSSAVTVNGTLAINNTNQTLNNLAGSGSVTVTTGNTLTDIGTSTFGGVISGAGNLATSGTGNLTLTAAQTYTGTTNVGSGTTLTLSTTNDEIATSSGVTVNGTVNMTGTNQTLRSLAGSGSVVTSTGNTLTENGTASWGGVISGAGNLATTGTGNWTVTTAQTYTGTTNVGSGSTLTLSTTADEIATSSAVTVNGTLAINNTNQTLRNLAGSGSVTVTTGNTLTENGTATWAGVISGAGNVATTGTGNWTVTTAQTYTGTTNVGSGTTLTLSTTNDEITNSSGVTVNGTVNMTGTNQTLRSLAGSGSVVTSTGNTLTENGTATWAGVISGAGNVTTAGSGNWTVTTAQTYTGATTVGSGTTLTLSTTNNEIATSSGVTNNGTINMTGTDQTFNALAGSGSVVTDTGHTLTEIGTASWGGVISGAGNVATTGTGTWTLTGTNTYTGTTSIGSGTTLSIAGQSNINGTSGILMGGSTLQLTGNSTISKTIALTGSNTINVGANTDLFSGVISGAGNLTVSGSGGTVGMTNTNTYTGTTTVSSGTTLGLVTTNDTIATSSTVTNNGTINMAGTNQTLRNLSGSGSIVTDSGHTLTENGTGTFSGVISGAGNVATTGTGTWTLSGVNTYTGTTTIGSGSTLSLTVNDAIATSSDVEINGVLDVNSTSQTLTNLSGSGSILLDGGTITQNGTNTFTGSVGDGSPTGGGLIVTGNGTWRVTGNNTYTGTTTIISGSTLQNDGSVASSTVTVNSGAGLKGIGTFTGQIVNNGTVAPGDSPGTLTVAGFTQNSGGTFEVEFSDTVHDQLIVTGSPASLDGKIHYKPLTPSSRYVRGTTYTIISSPAGSGTGRFTTTSSGATIGADNIVNASNDAEIAASSNPLLALQTLYSPTATQMKIVQAELFGNAPGATKNQAATGRALDGIQQTTANGSSMDTLLNALSAVGPTGQAAALETLSGQVNADIGQGWRENHFTFDEILSNPGSGNCDTMYNYDYDTADGSDYVAPQLQQPTRTVMPNSRYTPIAYETRRGMLARPIGLTAMDYAPDNYKALMHARSGINNGMPNGYIPAPQPVMQAMPQVQSGYRPLGLYSQIYAPQGMVAQAAPPAVNYMVVQSSGYMPGPMPTPQMMPSYQHYAQSNMNTPYGGAPRQNLYSQTNIPVPQQPVQVMTQQAQVVPQVAPQVQPQYVPQQPQQYMQQQYVPQQVMQQPQMQPQVVPQVVPQVQPQQYASMPPVQQEPPPYYERKEQRYQQMPLILPRDSQRVNQGERKQVQLKRNFMRQNVAAWGCAYGKFATLTGNSNVSDIKGTQVGGMVGLEFKPERDTLLRIGFGYGNNELELKQNNNTASLNSYQLGVYGQKNLDSNIYVGGAVGIGFDKGDTKRDIRVGTFTGTAKGSPEGQTFSASGTLGYKADDGDVQLGIFDTVSYLYNNQDAFVETGANAANLAVDSESTHALRNTLQVHVAKRFDIDRADGSMLIPELTAAYLYDAYRPEANATQTFDGTTARFKVDGTNIEPSALQAGAGMQLRLNNDFSVFGKYSGRFRNNETTHGVFGGMKYRW